jgi:ABC-2 type transport system ATP-binding protein
MIAEGTPSAAATAVARILEGRATGGELAIGDELIFGRATFPDDSEVSRRHARIARQPNGSYLLEDLGSTNGTYLNGWKIPAPQLLRSGDVLGLGQTKLEVSLPDVPPAVARREPIVQGAANVEAPASGAILYAHDVRKSYGDLSVLKGVSLEVQPGEIVGLLGSNGAGKTTFVSIVSGLRTADAGAVMINGVDAIARPREARAHVGIAPQDLGIYPTLTVRRNLEFFGELAGLRGSELGSRVEEIGEALSLVPKFSAQASTLSGGQQRRLHTGMAMMHKPPLLILDEPTVGADIRTRQEILDVVKKMSHEGHAVCYSTHYLPEIEELGASVAILDGGVVVARGSLAQLIREHTSQAVQLEFAGPAPALEVRGGEVTRDGAKLLIQTDNPTEMAAAVLGHLGANVARLRKVEIIQPGLDSVYLALTQRRYSPYEATSPENTPIEPGAQLWQQWRAPVSTGRLA